LAVLAIACKKNNARSNPAHSLVGKWTLTSYFYSDGSPGSWHPADKNNPQWITFSADNSFSSNMTFYGANKYELVDSTHIKLTPSTTLNGFVLLSYHIDSLQGVLQMSPANPICIEGCGWRFNYN
jgi:hypothetical protein